MAFTTRDLILVTSTVLLTAVTTTVVISTFTGDALVIEDSDASERTTWERTRLLQQEYMAGNPLKVKYKKEGLEVIDTLRGFVFSAKHLDEVINHNFSFSSTSSQTADEVLFLLGQDGTFSDLNGDSYGNMRLTAIGMKNDVLLITSTAGGPTASVSLFDKAFPCPPYCPD